MANRPQRETPGSSSAWLVDIFKAILPILFGAGIGYYVSEFRMIKDVNYKNKQSNLEYKLGQMERTLVLYEEFIVRQTADFGKLEFKLNSETVLQPPVEDHWKGNSADHEDIYRNLAQQQIEVRKVNYCLSTYFSNDVAKRFREMGNRVLEIDRKALNEWKSGEQVSLMPTTELFDFHTEALAIYQEIYTQYDTAKRTLSVEY